MSRLRFGVIWETPPEDEACGPEIPTWARLTVEVDGMPVTRNAPIESFSSEPARSVDYVSGPLAGLAEWFVDHHAERMREFGVPFPKLDDSGRAGVPGLRMAAAWWNGLRDETGADLATLALPVRSTSDQRGRQRSLGFRATVTPPR